MLSRILVPALALSFAASNVFAATVSPVDGDVLVSTGQGFHKIVAPVELDAGSQIIVSPKGKATIAYNTDCVVQVNPTGVAVIAAQSPCAAKFPKPMHFGYENAAVSGDIMGFTPKVGSEKKTAAEAPPPPPAPEPVYIPTQATMEEDDDNSGAYWIIGGVAVGAGALALILSSQGGDDPVSP